MIGLLAPMAVLVGYDCSVHMSEETRDASATLPKAIMASVLLNVTLVFIMCVTICFTLGDPEKALSGVTGYPFIQMFYDQTGSLPATNALTAIPIFMLAGCAFSEVAASSRQLWSFVSSPYVKSGNLADGLRLATRVCQGTAGLARSPQSGIYHYQRSLYRSSYRL